MKNTYPIVLTPSGSSYVVFIPDFSINTEGCSLTDAIEMARDAIGLVGIDMEDDGQPLPSPSNYTAVPRGASDVVTLVDIDFSEYRRKNDQRTVKKNCTLPSWLCYAAEKENINFSQVLQEALKARLCI